MTTLEFVRASQPLDRKRVIIRPKTEVTAKTPEQKRAVQESARQVIAMHRDVLMALKNR